MLNAICPKLPMRNAEITRKWYQLLGFHITGNYGDYLIMERDAIEIHFFLHNSLEPETNYGQVYIRCRDIESEYQQFLAKNITIHPSGHLEQKPWGQKEFSLLDPDYNLLTFGEALP